MKINRQNQTATPLKPKWRTDVESADIKGSIKRKHVTIQGVKFTLYSLGWIASLAKRDVHTLRRYEYKQIFPRPLVQTTDRMRWYLAEEVYAYSQLVKTAGAKRGLSIASTGLQQRLYVVRDQLRNRLKHDLKSLSQKIGNDDAIFDHHEKKRNLETSLRVHSKLKQQYESTIKKVPAKN